MRHGYVDVEGHQVHCASAGDENADSLVLLHQTPMWGVGHYQQALEALARRGWRAVALDTPGYGLSTARAEPTVADYARMVLAAADGVGMGRFHLFGRATGSAIAVQCAIDDPDRIAGLVLHGLTVYTADERADRLIDFAPPYRLDDAGFLEWLTDRIRGQYPRITGVALRDQLLGYLLAGEDYAAAYRAVWHYDIEAALEELDWGLVRAVLFGSADRLHDKHPRVARYLRDERLVMLEGASDFVAAEDPERFAEVVDRAMRAEVVQ